MKSKAIKQQDLDGLREQFSTDPNLFVVAFERLKVVAVDDLRAKVRESSGRYLVVKNTLARKAAEGTAVAELEPHFEGPTAVVLAEDAPAIAKTLKEFGKDHPGLTLKAGLVGGTTLDAKECEELADIPSREELISKLLFLMLSPLQGLATVLSAPSRNLAVVLGEQARKKEESGD